MFANRMEATALPMIVIRAWCALLVAFTGGAFGVIYAVGELFMMAGATINCARAVGWDGRAVGLYVPIMYAASFLIVPEGDVAGGLLVGFGVLTAARVYMQWHLGSRFSTGVCTWVGLCDSGPYRFVRHPMSASGFFWRAMVIVAWPSGWNILTGILYAYLSVAEILVEESWLRRQMEWVRYARDVRWRLLPGVW